MTESEFEAGMAALDAAAKAERHPQPVSGRIDVLVFDGGAAATTDA